MWSRRVVPIALTAAALASPACGKRTATFEVSAPEIGIHVLDAGAAPRAAIRYRWRAGMVVSEETTIEDTDTAKGVPRPGEVRDLEIRAVAVDADGTLHKRSRYLADREVVAPGARPLPREAAARRDKTGASFDDWIDARGRSTAPERVVARTGTSRLLFGVNDTDAVFPEDPIGVGARWEEDSSQMDPGGARHDTTVTFTLVALDGDHADVRFDASRRTTYRSWEIEEIGHGDLQVDLTAPITTEHSEWHSTARNGGDFLDQDTRRIDVVRRP